MSDTQSTWRSVARSAGQVSFNQFAGSADLDGAGADILRGGAVNDWLWGGEGDDLIVGGAGAGDVACVPNADGSLVFADRISLRGTASNDRHWR